METMRSGAKDQASHHERSQKWVCMLGREMPFYTYMRYQPLSSQGMTEDAKLEAQEFMCSIACMHRRIITCGRSAASTGPMQECANLLMSREARQVEQFLLPVEGLKLEGES
jgi:hypothetical protein